MTADELLSYLQKQGVEVWAEGDKLRYRGMKWTLPPRLISLLRKHKSELLVLLQDRSSTKSALLPLSFTQKAFWYLHELNPASVAYVGSLAVRLRGAISDAALQQALEQLGLRHPILRTRLVLRDGVPWQTVAPRPGTTLNVIEAAHWPEETVQQHLQAAANQPFDLLQEVPLRIQLYRISKTEHVLFWAMHHIYVDGWSMGLLLRELGALYLGALAARPVPLPPLPATYADFILWQQHFSVSPAGEAQLHYWLDQLLGDLPVLNLPTDRPRPPVRSEQGASVKWSLEPALVQRLKALATQEGTTLYAVLMSALALLLARYAGQDELLIGSPYHGRSEPRFNQVVGCFINSFVVRIRPEPKQSFRALLASIGQQIQGALAHADYPFAQLVERICPTRDSSHTPLFQALFAYENFLGADLVSSALAEGVTSSSPEHLFGVPLEAVPLSQMEGQFDLALTIIEAGAGLSCSLSYSTELFEESTARRLSHHFGQLLQSALSSPDQALHQLSQISAQEQHQLVVDWNRSDLQYPTHETFHQRFAAQARLSKEHIAVVYEGQQLTYQELDARTDHLAARLRSQGIGPGVWVGLLLTRSLDLVVGILGIFKAGGAYVALDPSIPDGRLSLMLKDTAAPVCVTQKQLRDRLPAYAGYRLFVDEDPAPVGSAAPAPIAGCASAEQLAYVLYTSGSTGAPRGVLITHRSILSLWAALAQEVYAPLPDRPLRIGMNASVAVDTSVEVFSQLLSGHTIHIFSTEAQYDAAQQVEYVRAHQLDVVETTPGFLSALFDAGMFAPSGHVPTRVAFGGEAISAELWRRICGVQETAFFNLYGPTECTVECTAARITADAASPHIGKVLANSRIYLLDGQRQVVPLGARGEIYIGGDGVGRGYLHQPELTAERFLPDPFSAQPGARMYRTGDLGRYLADGNIEYLGRIDHQVKLRGFRIELGEIESALGSTPQVAACVVLCREDAPGDKRLCAYIVLHPGAPADPQLLREHLARTLPDYMLPSCFVFLPRLPFTPNGKLDRKALPAPLMQRGADAYAAPRTPLEQSLAEIFARLLQRDRVGRHDNFFFLGGHSLLAVRLTAQVAQLTGRTLALSTLFQHPTIAELAFRLQDHLPSPAAQTVLPLQTEGRKPPLFCIHPVGGNVLCYVELGRALGPDQPLYGLQATPGPAHDDAPRETLEAVAARYVAAIAKVQPDGPYHLLGWSLGGVLAFAMAGQLRQAGKEVALLALLDAYAPAPSTPLGDAQGSESEGQRLAWFLRDLGQSRAADAVTLDLSVEALDLGARLDRLRKSGVLPEDSDLVQLAWLYAMYRRNLQLLSGHQPSSYPGPVVLLRAREPARPDDVDHGWGNFCTGSLEVLTAPGDHHSLLTPPNVLEVAALLAARMPGIAEPKHA